MDCAFDSNFHFDEIISVSKAMQQNGNNMILSISPGGKYLFFRSTFLGPRVTNEMIKEIQPYVDIYRITGDFWDCWDSNGCINNSSSTLRNHFDYFEKFQQFIPGPGINGLSFPDGDMIPLG